MEGEEWQPEEGARKKLGTFMGKQRKETKEPNEGAKTTPMSVIVAAVKDGSISLPPGWELRFTASEVPYYVDHNTKSTHKELPSEIAQLLQHSFSAKNSSTTTKPALPPKPASAKDTNPKQIPGQSLPSLPPKTNAPAHANGNDAVKPNLPPKPGAKPSGYNKQTADQPAHSNQAQPNQHALPPLPALPPTGRQIEPPPVPDYRWDGQAGAPPPVPAYVPLAELGDGAPPPPPNYVPLQSLGVSSVDAVPEYQHQFAPAPPPFIPLAQLNQNTPAAPKANSPKSRESIKEMIKRCGVSNQLFCGDVKGYPDQIKLEKGDSTANLVGGCTAQHMLFHFVVIYDPSGEATKIQGYNAGNKGLFTGGGMVGQSMTKKAKIQTFQLIQQECAKLGIPFEEVKSNPQYVPPGANARNMAPAKDLVPNGPPTVQYLGPANESKIEEILTNVGHAHQLFCIPIDEFPGDFKLEKGSKKENAYGGAASQHVCLKFRITYENGNATKIVGWNSTPGGGFNSGGLIGAKIARKTKEGTFSALMEECKKYRIEFVESRTNPHQGLKPGSKQLPAAAASPYAPAPAASTSATPGKPNAIVYLNKQQAEEMLRKSAAKVLLHVTEFPNMNPPVYRLEKGDKTQNKWGGCGAVYMEFKVKIYFDANGIATHMELWSDQKSVYGGFVGKKMVIDDRTRLWNSLSVSCREHGIQISSL